MGPEGHGHTHHETKLAHLVDCFSHCAELYTECEGEGRVGI